MKKITDRCIWIIGASSGVGRALAQELACMGNFVIVSARSEPSLHSLAMLHPGNIKTFPLDISDRIDMATSAAQLRELTDYIDMVICAAGICEYEDNFMFDPEMYRRTLDVNFLSVVRVFNLSLPLLKKSSQRPHFIAISSLSSCLGLPRAEAYGASKAALNYFMESLRADTAALNIDLSLIRPGFINTNMVKQNDFSMPLIMTPEQAAKKIIRGICARKFYIDFPRRLSWTLHLCALFFNPWCKWIAPRITRLHHW